MVNIVELDSPSNKWPDFFCQPNQVKKAILIALSTLMFLGMVLAYAVGAPWFVTASLFFFTLSPLFPLWKAVDDQKILINSRN